LLGWDAALKSRGINPGTSADLTVATLFASALTSMRGGKCAGAILP
jgi:triphosphoribosyl-dephospho-CoA synthase